MPLRHITRSATEDLKLDKLTHADAGQMHLYLNYARQHWTLEGENPPVGLILCAEKDHAVAHYALAAEYRTALPKERMLVAEIEKTIHQIETRRASVTRKTPRAGRNRARQ
jgi:hypothetical protein